ncbi:MAG: alpha/beta hydrolase [Deltaproteobacteria bacterium]|nr:alpha/beta hydrolase [Deltaproteobacteria bacterium]
MALRGWLLLKGLAREARHWGPFPSLLADAGRQPLLLDLPGVGTEHQRTSPGKVEGIVDDLRERFLRAGTGPWGLFAQSLGGMIALDWAARYPSDFVRVAVSNTSTSDLSPLRDRISRRGLKMLVRAGAERDPVRREQVALDLISNSPLSWARAAEFGQFAKDAPIQKRNIVRQLIAGARSRSPADLPIPLLVLASEHDRMVSWDCSRALAERYQATLRLHPSAGHELALDDPGWVVKELLAFEVSSD